MRGPALSALFGTVGSAMSLTPLDTFYPPLNQTSYITNSSAGTYGGFYRAGTHGPTGGAPYGTYDYCAMPHPRKHELPSEASGAKLVKLSYLQRHQRRSPYNILPGGEVG